MHWIIGRALTREAGYASLMQAIEKTGTKHTLVRKPPFVEYLIADHNDLDENGDNKPIMLDIKEPVFVTGTTSMQGVSRNHGWNPGFIDAPSQEECMEHWGEHMLNHGALFGEIGKIRAPEEGGFFIRPNEDLKSFAGTVMNAEKFNGWRTSLLAIDSWSSIPPETEVMIAPIRTIWAEYRCIVVNGRYVTGSRYKTGSRIEYSPDVAPMIINYVNERIGEWNPRRALCIDIAHTPEGLKVIETNSISSCGFYAIDMDIFVHEINSLG